MSLEEGAITYADLSPNANIQGHQIADKTLRLRNLSDDTFGIVKTGTLSKAAYTFDTGGAQYKWDNNAFDGSPVAHGLGYIPAILAFEFTGGEYGLAGAPLVWTASPASGFIQTWVQIYADSTNIYAVQRALGYNSSQTIGPWTVKYYLLQETAN